MVDWLVAWFCRSTRSVLTANITINFRGRGRAGTVLFNRAPIHHAGLITDMLAVRWQVPMAAKQLVAPAPAAVPAAALVPQPVQSSRHPVTVLPPPLLVDEHGRALPTGPIAAPMPAAAAAEPAADDR